jgi:branched-chain amino acid transport system ATP-binding protein
MSVLENILVALHHGPKANRRSLEDEAREVLSKVGLTHSAEMAAEVIPVGEAKRLELARVLATRPKCLLLDEPFGGLTSGEIEPLVEIIRSLEVEVILVEHRLRQVLPLVDRVIVMDQGRCIADGTASDVVSNRTVLRAYFGERGVEDLGLS